MVIEEDVRVVWMRSQKGFAALPVDPGFASSEGSER
jgi:hypothetical protein